jgi:hypothetical protein
MTETVSLRQPEILRFYDENTRLYYGARQTWYEDAWQKRAGCGPTAASHLIWYLARTRAGCAALAPFAGNTKTAVLSLMRQVWPYVTPGVMGVNSTDIFTEGAARYGQAHNVRLSARVMPVPVLSFLRPSAEHLASFIAGALTDGLPVAFLNLSNGRLTNLDNWHWVTLVACQPASLTALMYDDGAMRTLDLGLWLTSTLLGGGFVAIEPQSRAI